VRYDIYIYVIRQLKVKNINFFVIILLWQHILYLCTLFLVHGRQVDLPPCTRNNVQDMLPQQYYNEKVNIFNT